jgi:hypothetical protein
MKPGVTMAQALCLEISEMKEHETLAQAFLDLIGRLGILTTDPEKVRRIPTEVLAKVWREILETERLFAAPDAIREATKLRAANEALSEALVYAQTKRGSSFDFDEWNRLVEHAMKGERAPSALENEIASHQATRQALDNVRKEREALREGIRRYRRIGCPELRFTGQTEIGTRLDCDEWEAEHRGLVPQR